MLDNQCNSPLAIPTSRLERLLRERELRRSTRASQSNEESRETNGDVDISGNMNDQYLSDCEKGSREEDLIGGNAFANHANDGYEKQETARTPKQRLLVVANRLPVSAIRKSQNSWALEISVGGLVSALLGKIKPEVLAVLCLLTCFSTFNHTVPFSITFECENCPISFC